LAIESDKFRPEDKGVIKKKTVFVLGAGASAEAGYPMGRELRNRIIFELDGYCNAAGPPAANEVLGQHDCRKEELVAFRDALRRSGTASIDEFLENRH
jgi:hypothetical protein